MADVLTPSFKLAADLQYTGTEQIEVYTVEKTADGWADTEVPFGTASVTIGGADNKTVSVTGFNFAAHCITDSPKGGSGSDYGRKLVIYIPIVHDSTADTFGGWLRTNAGAAIYQDANASQPTITAPTAYADVAISYSMTNTARAYHINTDETYTVTYDADYLNGILDSMITRLPDGVNNEGVSMVYKLWDAGTIDKDESTSSDQNDDVLLATVTVPAGQNVDVTDFANWTVPADAPNTGTITVDEDLHFGEKIYILTCTLTSTNPVNPESKLAYAFLDIAVTNEEKSHIVYGYMDEGGVLTVASKGEGNDLAGALFNNSYTESVKEGDNSDIMTFTPKEGYEIETILLRTLSHGATQREETVIYSADAQSNTVTPDANGVYTFQAVNITGGVEVIVETRIKSFKLTTESDAGSEIIGDTTYTYDARNDLTVPFQAISGYKLTTLTIDGVVYDITKADVRASFESGEHTAQFTMDGENVVGGHIHVSRVADHDVKIASAARSYNVTLHYMMQTESGQEELTDMAEGPTSVIYGTKIFAAEAPAYMPGDVKAFGEDNYTLSDWYTVKNEIVTADTTMPAADLHIYALWTKNPDVKIATVSVEKNVSDAYAKASTFEFVALFHEQDVGSARITIPANSSASVTAQMDIVLTDSQAQSFKEGNGYIYIYEPEGDHGEIWIYDNTLYSLRWVNGETVLYKGNEKVENGKASFTNVRVNRAFELDKELVKVNDRNVTPEQKIYVGDKLTWEITVENIGNAPYEAGELTVVDTFVVNGVAKEVILEAGDSGVTQSKTNEFILPAIGAGASISFNVSYTVQESDAGLTLVNKAAVGNDGTDSPGVPVEPLPTVTVEYYAEDINGNQTEIEDPTNQTNPFSVAEGESWSVAVESGDANYIAPKNVTYNGANYIFEKALDATSGTMTREDVTVRLVYAIDEIGGGDDKEEPDTIPDKYQVIIKYVAEGSGSVSPAEEVVTLRDASGALVTEAEVTAASTAAANAGYSFSAWSGDKVSVTAPAEAALSQSFTAQGGSTYTFTASFTQNKYTVKYVDGVDGAEVFEDQTTNDLVYGAATPAFNGTPEREGYTFTGWSPEVADIVTGNATYTAQWEKDVITDPDEDDDPDKPGDTIPDKYQIVIKYVAEGNGSVSPAEEVVTLRDASGALVTEAEVTAASTAAANAGYSFSAWSGDKVSVTAPAEAALSQSFTAQGGSTYTFTASFTQNKYTVKYVDGVDGAEVFEDQTTNDLVYGAATPAFNGTPEREGYTFTGWSPEVADIVTGNATYTAQWEKKAVPPVVPTTGAVHLTKVDSADNTITIPGVVFQLYAANGKAMSSYSTNSSGVLYIDGLTPGSYYLVETRPAQGYVLSDEPIHFTVSTMSTTTLTVTNTRADVPGVFTDEHYAYVIGYPDGLVHPEGNITRAEVATIFFRLLNEETRQKYLTKENSFSDVNEGDWFNTAVSTMAAMGVINGYPDGSFRPNANISRAEFAAIAARFDIDKEHGSSTFIDVKDHWAEEEISISAYNGWILGYPDGKFLPDKKITRAEAMSLVNRVLQRIPRSVEDLLPNMIVWPDNMDTKMWYYLAVQEATNSHEYSRYPDMTEHWIALREVPDWKKYER